MEKMYIVVFIFQFDIDLKIVSDKNVKTCLFPDKRHNFDDNASKNNGSLRTFERKNNFFFIELPCHRQLYLVIFK